MTGYAFSPEVLAATPTPQVPKHLLPWLLKDRREAVTGAYRVAIGKDGPKEEHDRMGLDYATKELRRIERELAGAEGERAAILRLQRDQQRVAVQFWEGKCTLLDRIIAATQSLP